MIDTTDYFDEWLSEQDDDMIDDVLASLKLLEQFGPMLGRPDVDQIKGSDFPNMKELRVQSNGRSEPFCFRSAETGYRLMCRRQERSPGKTILY